MISRKIEEKNKNKWNLKRWETKGYYVYQADNVSETNMHVTVTVYKTKLCVAIYFQLILYITFTIHILYHKCRQTEK